MDLSDKCHRGLRLQTRPRMQAVYTSIINSWDSSVFSHTWEDTLWENVEWKASFHGNRVDTKPQVNTSVINDIYLGCVSFSMVEPFHLANMQESSTLTLFDLSGNCYEVKHPVINTTNNVLKYCFPTFKLNRNGTLFNFYSNYSQSLLPKFFPILGLH